MRKSKEKVHSLDSFSALLLTLIALSGEFPSEQIARLPSTDAYKGKVIKSLKNCGLIRTYYRDGLRGLRLTAAAKKQLAADWPDRFSPLFTGDTMTNAPKYTILHRLRLHRMAEAFISMLNAGVSSFPWQKPVIFTPTPLDQAPYIERPAYFSSREVKGLGNAATKIRNSRAVGVLLTGTGHILTGKLAAVQRTRNGMDTAVVMFKNVQVLMPLKEMAVHTGPVPSGPDYAAWVVEVIKHINARQNSDVDFVVRGFGFNEAGERIVAGSRRDAMRRKRRRFYLDTDELGNHLIEEGGLVQARVVAVAEKSIRLEVFGVECAVSAGRVSRMWVSSIRAKYAVGDTVTVRVTRIELPSAGDISIQVDARDVFGREEDKLCLCQRSGRYVGEVTDVRRGVFFIRLSIGVNAISHDCRDMRMPGRKDTVSFTVTRLDEKNGVAIGIINRIIKQNL